MNADFSPYLKGLPNHGGDMKVVKVCPVCQTSYYPWQAQVLEERPEAHLIYVECHKCGSGQVALIISSAMGVSTVGLVTDLTPADIVKFKSSEPVSVDDILEIHTLVADPAAAVLDASI